MKKFFLPVLALAVLSADSSAQPLRRIMRGETPFRDALFGSQGACGAAAAAGACSASAACSAAPATACGASTSTAVALAGRHPIAHQWVRLKFTAFLVKKGKSFSEARAMADSVSDEMLEQAGAQVGAPGGFFSNLLAALQQCEADPTCSKFLAALMNYLLTLLGG